MKQDKKEKQDIVTAVKKYYENQTNQELVKDLREIRQKLSELCIFEQNVNISEHFPIGAVVSYGLRMKPLPHPADLLFNPQKKTDSALRSNMFNYGRKTADPKIKIFSRNSYTEPEFDTASQNYVAKSQDHMTLHIEVQESAILFFTLDGSFPTERNSQRRISKGPMTPIQIPVEQRSTIRMVAKHYLKAQSNCLSVELLPKFTGYRIENTIIKPSYDIQSATFQSDPEF